MYQICFLIFSVHKFCRTLENSILHFVVGKSQFVSCMIHKYVNTSSDSSHLLVTIQSHVCESINGCDTLLNKQHCLIKLRLR